MDEQNYKRRLEKFSSSLHQKLQIYREEKRRWDPFLSTDFNVVSEFIIINENYFPRENRLSDIIKCLLDVNGSHGQQGKFLEAFLKRLYEKNHFDTDIEQRPYFLKCLFEKNRPDRVAELSGKQRQVEREAPTLYNENRRRLIDITVDFEGFGIGIENKPWTHEGNNQLGDYYSNLKRKYKNKEFCLVFITPDGRKPETIRNRDDLIQKGELYCLSYRSDILGWIEECWQLCESDKFRWFLHDFREYIRDEPFAFEENDDAKE